MLTPRYALVAYVRNPVGEFVERLRRQLHPELPHLAAHLTVLPPRLLQGTERSAVETLEDVCSQVAPFTVTLGDVETFCPRTPTVFIRVAEASYRMRELHDQLNIKALAVRGRVALHASSHHREDERRVAGAESLSRGPRALGPLRRQSRHPGKRADFRPRRRTRIAGWILPESRWAASWCS